MEEVPVNTTEDHGLLTCGYFWAQNSEISMEPHPQITEKNTTGGRTSEV